MKTWRHTATNSRPLSLSPRRLTHPALLSAQVLEVLLEAGGGGGGGGGARDRGRRAWLGLDGPGEQAALQRAGRQQVRGDEVGLGVQGGRAAADPGRRLQRVVHAGAVLPRRHPGGDPGRSSRRQETGLLLFIIAVLILALPGRRRSLCRPASRQRVGPQHQAEPASYAHRIAAHTRRSNHLSRSRKRLASCANDR